MANKNNARKVTIDGIVFDSKKEGRRYEQLKLQEESGEISDLQYHVKFPLIPKQKRSDGTTERAVFYIADFVYEKQGEKVVEDAKGYRNPSASTYALFVLKRKLMLYVHGITIQEV